MLQFCYALPEVPLQRFRAARELRLLLLPHGRQLLQRGLRMRLHARNLCEAWRMILSRHASER